MKRTLDMVDSTPVVNDDILNKLANELHLASLETMSLLINVLLDVNQFAFLCGPSFTTSQDIYDKFKFSDDQELIICHALGISVNVDAFKEKRKPKSEFNVRRFLIDLHRCGIHYDNGNFVVKINNENVTLRLKKWTSEALHDSTIPSGYKSNKTLRDKYCEKNRENFEKILTYLWYQYSSPLSDVLSDAIFLTQGKKAAHNFFIFGNFVDVHDEKVRADWIVYLIKKKMSLPWHKDAEGNTRGCTEEQAKMYAIAYMNVYAERFWSAAAVIYCALKKNENAPNLPEVKIQKLATAPPDLLKEMQDDSFIWQNVIKELRKYLFIDAKIRRINNTHVDTNNHRNSDVVESEAGASNRSNNNHHPHNDDDDDDNEEERLQKASPVVYQYKPGGENSEDTANRKRPQSGRPK